AALLRGAQGLGHDGLADGPGVGRERALQRGEAPRRARDPDARVRELMPRRSKAQERAPETYAKLRELHPDARALEAADVAGVSETLRTLGMGMYNQKGKNIVGLARMLVEKHGGQVPRTLAELVELPGVGRKTANVVLGVAWNTPEGVVVDTHVQRLSQRLGWTKRKTPEEIEEDLCKLFPRSDWDML